MEHEAEALEICRESVIIDGLGPVFWYQDDKDKYLGTVHDAGLTAFNHTMIRPYDYWPEGFVEFAEAAQQWRLMSERHPDMLVVALSSQDIVRAKKTARVAVIFSLQNPFPMGARVDHLAGLYHLGLRICQLSYQRRSLLADGCGESTNSGLSHLGNLSIKEMNRLGILVDLSHCGHRSSLEAIEASSDPVIVSHAGVRALTETPRNLQDDQIDAVAQSGGVIGVVGEKAFIRREGRSFIDAYVDHMEYLLDRAGDDHVGIGFDLAEGFNAARLRLLQQMLPEMGMEEVDYAVPDLNSPTKIPNLVARLLSRGHAKQTIQKILGLNFLRVFGRVWDHGVAWREAGKGH